jgi:hypothetical protein
VPSSKGDPRFSTTFGTRPDLRHCVHVRKDGFGGLLYDLPLKEETVDVLDIGDVVLNPEGGVSGVVVDENDRPLPNMRIALREDVSARRRLMESEAADKRDETSPLNGHYLKLSARSDALGRFCFRGLSPGAYRVSCQGREGFEPPSRERPPGEWEVSV